MKALLLILLSAVFSGCIPTKVSRTLKDVESYITERPDSALSVLQSIGNTNLRSNRVRAHHALLQAMALDKNYIDVTDDSLASVALSYYSRKGPEKYEARALYYLGLSYYYAGFTIKPFWHLQKLKRWQRRATAFIGDLSK